MKKLLFVVLAVSAVAGCKSIDVERYASSVATVEKADGSVEVIRDAANNPVVLDGGWNVEYFQHWNWQKFDGLKAQAGPGVTLEINNYSSGADSNLTALVAASLKGATELIATAAEAYVKVAGGGAQADTALAVGQKIYEYFSAQGGDVSKATVTTADNKIVVSDGTTSIQCDSAGNCTDCTVK